MSRFSPTISKSIYFLIVFTFSFFLKTVAQTNSRMEVTSTKHKTTIQINDFPKNATVLLVDGTKNIIAVLSTNNSGSGSLTLKKSIKTSIIARTMNGDISVSNEPVIKVSEENIAAITKSYNTKA